MWVLPPQVVMIWGLVCACSLSRRGEILPRQVYAGCSSSVTRLRMIMERRRRNTVVVTRKIKTLQESATGRGIAIGRLMP